MKKTGVWIDKREAKIVRLNEEKESLKSIKSEVEEFNPIGGSGSKGKGGPQDVVQDSRYTNREKQQFKAFFDKVVEEVKNAEVIVIFGPAETGEKLNKLLAQHYPAIQAKISSVEKADVMTDNQLKAWVKDHFDS